jgi:hypothetical protein
MKVHKYTKAKQLFYLNCCYIFLSEKKKKKKKKKMHEWTKTSVILYLLEYMLKPIAIKRFLSHVL